MDLDDQLTGLEHLLLAGRRLGLPPAEARVRAACLLIGLDLGEIAERPVRAYPPVSRRALALALDLYTRDQGVPEVVRTTWGTP
jgi:ABC-type multidrug transport system ATPase subunit